MKLRHMASLVLFDGGKPSPEHLAKDTETEYRRAEAVYCALNLPESANDVVMGYILAAQMDACEKGIKEACELIREACT